MDEIFGRSGFVCNFVWKSRKSEDTRAVTGASVDHEYILCYSGIDRPKLRGAEKDLSKFSNPDDDPRGPWRSADLTGLADKSRRPNLHYELLNPATAAVYECPPKGWRFDRSTMARKIEEGRILWPAHKGGRPRHKIFLSEMASDYKNISSLISEFSTSDGTRELNAMLGANAFDFPKPTDLIAELMKQVGSADFYIMDSFCGSGTTGHAALKLNSDLNLRVNFILIEMDEDIALGVASKRLKHAINGYVDAGGSTVTGLGGGFRYCTLGAPLFDAEGDINEAVAFRDLAAHVFFCETGSPIPKQASPANPLIGAYQGRAIYLLYNRDSAGVASQRAGNVLNLAALGRLPETDAAERVVYAEGCTIPPERLRSEGVIFKHIPYQIGGL